MPPRNDEQVCHREAPEGPWRSPDASTTMLLSSAKVDTFDPMANERLDRAAIMRVFHEIWEANKNVSPADVEKRVEQAIAEVRAEKRRAAKRSRSSRARRRKN